MAKGKEKSFKAGSRAPTLTCDVPPDDAEERRSKIYRQIESYGAELKNADDSFTEATYNNAERLYATASTLRDSPDDWMDFLHAAQGTWGHRPPKTEDNEEALRFVMKLAFGLNDRGGQQKASKWWSSLRGLWEGRVGAAQMRSILDEHGGIAGAKAYAASVTIRDGQILESMDLRVVADKLPKKLVQVRPNLTWKLELKSIAEAGTFSVVNAKRVKVKAKRK